VVTALSPRGKDGWRRRHHHIITTTTDAASHPSLWAKPLEPESKGLKVNRLPSRRDQRSAAGASARRRESQI
jgi:hypothetical protein